jgi:hypothetical protein
VQPVVGDELDRNDDVDRMDDMVADIGRGYDLKFEDPPSEVQNFYSLLAASEEKVHDDTDVTVLQTVTCLMAFKLKYIFLNYCYNDIIKLIIDLIPVKHSMMKELYQSKKIVYDLKMNYEEIDACEKNCVLFWNKYKDNTECQHCGKSIYVKVINKNRASATTYL